MSAASVGNVVTKAGQNAGALEHANQQMGQEASAFDVWTHSYDGMADRMRGFADDPAGALANFGREQDAAVAAGLTGDWHSSSFSAVGDSIAAQADGLGDMVNAIGEAEGALATVGATFALLTGVEQMLSTLVSVIPFPALPAIRIMDMDVGLPHGHMHPPNLVPPAPMVPLPSTGPIIPIPILSGAVRTLINGMPAARCGDMGLGIWCGGYFPMYEVFLGSSSVWIEGARAGRLAVDITKHCIFTSPKPQDLPLGPMVGVTIMASGNVLIGGVPMPSLVSLAMAGAMKAFMKGLGKAAKAFDRATRGLRQRLFRNMKPGFLRCRVLRAEPVNVVTGEVIINQQDFSIPGRIPIEWNRSFGSQHDRAGVCGRGWETPADARLVVLNDGYVAFFDGSLSPTCFDGFPTTEPIVEAIEGDALAILDQHFVVRRKNGLTYHFPISTLGVREIPVAYVTDSSRNFIYYQRDTTGLRRIGDSSGRRIDVESVDGLIRSMRFVAADGSSGPTLVRFAYDELRNLCKVSDAHDRSAEFVYDDYDLIRQTDRNGLSFYYEYDGVHPVRRCARTWGDGGLYHYRFFYDDATLSTRFEDALGNPWTIMRNERYQIDTEIDPLGQATHFEYDPAGRTAAVIGPSGDATRYDYDDQGNLTTLSRPNGSASRAEYDTRGLPLRVSNFGGGLWTYTWNDRGLLEERTTPGGKRWRFAYSEQGDLVNTIDPAGRHERCGYDGNGNLVSVRAFSGSVTRYEYDTLGNMVGTTDPLGHTLRFIYDFQRRPVRILFPSGRSVHCEYDNEGNLTRFVDPGGRVTLFAYAGLGEVVKRANPDGSTREFTYDAEERLVEIVNEDGQRNTLELDPIGRVVKEVRYGGYWQRFSYGQSGRAVQRTDASGRVLRYQYDTVGRLTSIVGNPGVAEYFEYDDDDRMLVGMNSERRVEWKYDADGNVVEEIQGDAATKYGYDDLFNRTMATLPSGRAVHYSYDADGGLSGIDIDNRVLLRVRRNKRGEIEEEVLGSACRRQFHYDVDGLLTSQLFRGGQRIVVDRRYSYDPSGEMISMHDRGFGAERFSYDKLGRIQEHHRDSDGRNASQHTPVRRTDISTLAPPGGWFSVDGASYRVDAAGNIVERKDMNGTTEFQYDALDRLVKMSKSVAETHYGYDALGRRIWKERGGSRREFLWDGDVLLQETGGDTSNREYLYYPDCFEPLAILDRTAFYIVGTDAAGAVREVHGESGDVVWKAFYHAKGGVESEATADIENPLRLLGQYFDVESGLHYNRNRYYDPQLGAFTSQDPWFCGEDAYSYGPNVWSWSDPLGLVCPRLARRLAARIRRMQRNMTPFERSRTTFAAAEVRLPNGRREVWVAAAGQRGYVPPRIRGRADRMIVAPARPQHAHLPHVNDAERALLRAARREGATIDGIRATRPMCDHCQDALNRGGASGGVIPD